MKVCGFWAFRVSAVLAIRVVGAFRVQGLSGLGFRDKGFSGL